MNVIVTKTMIFVDFDSWQAKHFMTMPTKINVNAEYVNGRDHNETYEFSTS